MQIQDCVTPLIAGAMEGHASVVKLLLAAKADINCADIVRKMLRYIKYVYKCIAIVLDIDINIVDTVIIYTFPVNKDESTFIAVTFV